MPPSHAGNRITAGLDLRDHPRFVLVAPRPPATRAGEHLKPLNRPADSTIHCVHSKPNGQNQAADSQIRTSAGRWRRNDAYEMIDYGTGDSSGAIVSITKNYLDERRP